MDTTEAKPLTDAEIAALSQSIKWSYDRLLATIHERDQRITELEAELKQRPTMVVDEVRGLLKFNFPEPRPYLVPETGSIAWEITEQKEKDA